VITLLRDFFQVLIGCAGVLLALFVVMSFLTLHLVFRLLWWVFTLPERVMGAKWVK